MRRTIEIERCRFFDIEHTLARGLAGLQLRMNKLFWVIIYAIWKLTSTMGNKYIGELGKKERLILTFDTIAIASKQIDNTIVPINIPNKYLRAYSPILIRLHNPNL
ncbi:hypothetical protein [Streptococcus agalactiae]